LSSRLFLSDEVKKETTSISPPAADDTNALADQLQSSSTTTTEEPQSETQKLLAQIKDAGIAGVISYAAWEVLFWAVSLPLVVGAYIAATGHTPNLNDSTDVAQLSGEALAFVNLARLVVPVRIGLALSTIPWVQSNIVDRFGNKEEDGV